MKVCVLFPRFIVRNFGMPLGALYIVNALKKAGFEVVFTDGTVTSCAEAKERLLKERPDVLLVSMHTVFADYGFEISGFFKKNFPENKVVIGGPHASIMPEKTLKHESVDFVSFGEGEESIIELLKNISHPEKVKGIGFKKKGRPFLNAPASPICELDKLEFPDRTVLDDAYFKNGSSSIVTSRGCPFNCAFCQPTLNKIFGKDFRIRSPENVIKEIKEIKRVFKEKGAELKELHFTDDGLTYNKQWLEKLAKLMLMEKLGISWSANTRADTMPGLELLKLLKKTGLKSFSIGVESGDPYIRNEILRKGLSQEKLLSAFKLCKQAGIKTEAYLMVGSPEESEQSIQATLNVLDEIIPDFTQVTITSPLPETYLAQFVDEKKIGKVEKWSDFAYGEQSHLKLENFTKEQIKRVQMALVYAILSRAFLKNRFGIEAKYSALFRIFRPSIVNYSLRTLQFLRFKAKNLLKGN
ncbi:MAG: B12-binding domain-containing radical SAM protein [Candidatus Diapherotrites archaeon]|uniref:B12-binding domain-containing radical SAM protein n=1 Tax=Candidatus Iainarchaeum sp. TaxID=3101447 RepID=A0A8T4KU37_9ARCH|nr:B12-binding domain-containing radical SAM protein [Candidatus Diapherotrites archaeon]